MGYKRAVAGAVYRHLMRREPAAVWCWLLEMERAGVPLWKRDKLGLWLLLWAIQHMGTDYPGDPLRAYCAKVRNRLYKHYPGHRG